MEALLTMGFALFLAFANGANDNFKGVATLWGSKVTDFKGALLWATVTTWAGSICAMFLAQGLLVAFSGKGLVPDAVLALPSFAFSVALAAALTVMLATVLGLPVSTTHALTGALVGVGLVASASGVNFTKLWNSFAQPLLVAPVLGALAAVMLYPTFRWVRRRSGITSQACVCVGKTVVASYAPGTSAEQALSSYRCGLGVAVPQIALGSTVSCVERYQGQLVGVRADTAVNALHYVSAGAVSFARGMNDTPKMAALMLVGTTVSATTGALSIGVFMIVGGLLGARKVANTMANNVTTMNSGQGFTANLVTAALVLGASRFGLPVSTTHVSCGALFGIGAVTGTARWKTIAGILLAWVTTLPLAGVIGAVTFRLLG